MASRLTLVLLALVLFAGCATSTSPLATRTYTDDSSAPTSMMDQKIEKNLELSRQFPKEPTYHERIASDYWFGKKDHSNALDHLEKARELDPENPRYDLFEARIYYAVASLNMAETSYKRVIAKTQERFTGPHYELAWFYMMSSQHEEAAEQFRKCLEIDPDLAGAHYGLGKVAELRRDESETIHQLEEYLRLGGGINSRDALQVLHRLQPEVKRR